MLLSTDTNSWSIRFQPRKNGQCFLRQVAAAKAFIRGQVDQTWLLHNTDRTQFSVWLMALLTEGRTPVLPSNGQAETLRRLLVVTDRMTPSELPEVQARDVELSSLTGTLDNEVVMYTSGSSGEAKMVRKSVRQLFNEVRTLEDTFGVQLDSSNILTSITHQHIYGLLFTVLWPLCSGRVVVPGRIEYPEQWQYFHQHSDRPYVLVTTPAHLERFSQAIDLADYKLLLTSVFSSGGVLNESVPARFVHAGIPPPIEVYGSTETGGIAWRQRYLKDTPFCAFKSVNIKTNSDNQLQVRSPHLGSMDWYTTSDKVILASAIEFTMQGRADRVVKLSEKRLSLDEMESYVHELDWVACAKCCVLKGKVRNELGLVIELNDVGQKQVAGCSRFHLWQVVRKHLNQYFEKVVLPRKIRYVASMPYNDAGKITDESLRMIFADETKE